MHLTSRSFERQLAAAIRGLVEEAYERGRQDGTGDVAESADRLLSVADAADLLGLPRKRVYELMARGQLDRVELGERTLRTTARSVRDLIATSSGPVR